MPDQLHLPTLPAAPEPEALGLPDCAIMRYILHYTDPGDIVLDGFCGTGITGVAAQLCADRQAVESLGYRALDDGTILDEKGRLFSRLGARKAVLVDLCPTATFIAYNYNTSVGPDAFEREARRILQEDERSLDMNARAHHAKPFGLSEPGLAGLSAPEGGFAG